MPVQFGRIEWAGTLEQVRDAAKEEPEKYPADWWTKSFHNPPTKSEQQGHACGAHEMLMIVAYDIANPKRLSHVAKHCEDFGVRVQYSVFECRLTEDEFGRFWMELRDLIDKKQDRLVAYKVCASCAGEVLTMGNMAVTSSVKPVAYIF